jgi:transcriptional regulator with XRE-family HTH domain
MTGKPDQRWTATVGTAANFLGQELLRLRLEDGISLRRLARMFGMSAHSGLVDYERGSRIPPANIMQAYARVFTTEREYLMRLHRAAMVERAAGRIAARV